MDDARTGQDGGYQPQVDEIVRQLVDHCRVIGIVLVEAVQVVARRLFAQCRREVPQAVGVAQFGGQHPGHEPCQAGY